MKNSKSKTSISFLFGSGLSLNAGLTNTDTLSSTIIQGKNVYKTTNGSFSIDKDGTHKNAHYPVIINGIIALLSQLKAEADMYYFRNRLSNYEDWYYLAQQLHAGITGDYDNPALRPFIWDLREKLGDIVRPQYPNTTSFYNDKIDTLTEHTVDYIRDLVLLSIQNQSEDLNYLKWIVEAIGDSDFKKCGIFTLNYDLVLETLLTKNKIAFCDGFDPTKQRDSEIAFWTPQELINSDSLILGKLHGSLGWHHVSSSKPAWSDGQIYRKQEAFRKPFALNIPKGFPQTTPLILVGRHNKTLSYTGFLYEDLQYSFTKSLRSSNILIVCGYGFGDKAINSKLINWKFEQPDNLVLVIDPQNPFTNLSSRFAIHSSLENWEKDNTARWIDKTAEKVTWSEIREELLKTPKSN